MTEQKLNEIANVLIGLKAYEWSNVKTAVDKVFSQKYTRTELDNKEKLLANLKLEIGELN